MPAGAALNPVAGALRRPTLAVNVAPRADLAFELADDPRAPQVQQGERLFFTSRPDTISRDNWVACATCHLDGGPDGRTWLGSEGGARNTTTLRAINETEPLHWSADRADVQAFEETFTGLMAGSGPTQSELDALAAFLLDLHAIPSPRRDADGSLTNEARRGADIFEAAGCAVCHTGPAFTDRELHDVGTSDPHVDSPNGGKVLETLGSAYDTPGLRELWQSAPYLHDGRAPTLRDVLVAFNDGRHGDVSDLTEDEIDALEAFLLQLPLTDEEYDEMFVDGG